MIEQQVDTFDLLKPFTDKVIQIKHKRDVEDFLASLCEFGEYESLALCVFHMQSPKQNTRLTYGNLELLHACTDELELLQRQSRSEYRIGYKQEGYLIIPLQGIRGMVAFVLIKTNQLNQLLTEWMWSIVGPTLLHRIKEISRHASVNITSREQHCMLWAAEGKTSWEISKILGISERTVNFHLYNCIEKTNSSNRQQAIVKYLMTQPH